MTSNQFISAMNRKQAEYVALCAVLVDIVKSLPRDKQAPCRAALAAPCIEVCANPCIPEVDFAITAVLQDIATAMEHLLVAMETMLATARIRT